MAIDIGHGTDTPGKGYGDFSEHWFNSEVAIKVMDKLDKLGVDYDCLQSPHSEEIDLNERVWVYNSNEYDLVYSIHGNASGSESVDGCCCFVWSQTELAKQHVKHLQDNGFDLHGNGIHLYEDGTWTDLAIIEDVKHPSILTENGFFTNSTDRNMMKTEEYQQRVADVIVADIVWYLRRK